MTRKYLQYLKERIAKIEEAEGLMKAAKSSVVINNFKAQNAYFWERLDGSVRYYANKYCLSDEFYKKSMANGKKYYSNRGLSPAH